MQSLKLFFSTLCAGILLFSSCEPGGDATPGKPCITSLHYDDTLAYRTGDIKVHCEDDINLKMDSIFNDSRCPINAMCVWEGSASVAFTFMAEGQKHKFVLETADIYPHYSPIYYFKDYQIELLDLTPYPGSITTGINPDQYLAIISVYKKTRVMFCGNE